MGESDVCTGDLVGVARKRHITSFGEDEDGEIYILAVDDATPTTTDGVVYQLVDPARYVGVAFMNNHSKYITCYYFRRESPIRCKSVRD